MPSGPVLLAWRWEWLDGAIQAWENWAMPESSGDQTDFLKKISCSRAKGDIQLLHSFELRAQSPSESDFWELYPYATDDKFYLTELKTSIVFKAPASPSISSSFLCFKNHKPKTAGTQVVWVQTDRPIPFLKGEQTCYNTESLLQAWGFAGANMFTSRDRLGLAGHKVMSTESERGAERREFGGGGKRAAGM